MKVYQVVVESGQYSDFSRDNLFIAKSKEVATKRIKDAVEICKSLVGRFFKIDDMPAYQDDNPLNNCLINYLATKFHNDGYTYLPFEFEDVESNDFRLITERRNNEKEYIYIYVIEEDVIE